MRPWLLAVVIVLATAAGLGVGYLVGGRGTQQVQEQTQREISRREGEIADLRKRLAEAEERARREAEQRQILEEAVRRAKIWK